jgi:predicted phosphodiesterase
VRLWILSDLHMESTRGWDLPPPAERPIYDVLVVAGDLTTRMERGVAWLRERVTDRQVVYVHGNHESYGQDLDRTLEKAQLAAAGTNIHVVQDGTVRIADVTFAGCCLWTDFDLFGDPRHAMAVASEQMNDFRKIRIDRYSRRFHPHNALERHRRSRAFLESELRNDRGDRKLVVVSHHAPVRGLDGNDPLRAHRTIGDREILTAAYRSDLSALRSPAPDDGHGALRPADVWLYGHTHESFDAIVVGVTRIVSNAKGYGPFRGQDTWENPGFDPKLVIEI